MRSMTSRRRPGGVALQGHQIPRLSRWRVGIGVLLVGATLAAGCGGGSSSGGGSSALEGGGTTPTTAAGQPKPGGNLRVVHVSNPSSLDPHTGGSGNDHFSLYPMYDRLVNFSPDKLEPQPGLAESWKFPDPQTLVFTLRSGVKFHDGTPFDAEAVLYNIERAKTLPKSTVKGETASIESAEVTGPLQVTLHLKRPDTALILILADRAGMMVSPTAAKAKGGELANAPVGTGPFQFVEWLPNDRLVMKKNPNYWQAGKPYLDGITIRFLTDSQTGINALLANETDLKTSVEPADIESLKRNGSLQVVTSPSLSQEECYFNFTKPPFNNLQFRQAVQYAVNRDAFNTALLFGEGAPAYQLLPKQHWAYQADLAKPWAFDQKKARELLAASGLQGTPVKGITYDGPGQARKAEIVQAQLKEVGIDMTIETMEVGAATKTFFEGLGHDIYCAGWSGRPDPNQTMSSLFSSTGYYNAGKYSPAGLDQLIADAAKSDSTADRAKAYGPLTKAYIDNALILSLVFRPSIVAMQKSVKNYTASLYKPDISFVWLEK